VTRSEHLWRAIKRNPGLPVRDIADLIEEENRHVVSMMLERLKVEGCVRLSGKRPHTVWYATDIEPKQRVLGRKRTARPPPPTPCYLAAILGYIPHSTRGGRIVDNFSREDAPAESEAA
jgi:hypothetical protein